MKILHVMAGAPTGGAENIFLEDVLALADGGVRQHVLTRPNNDFRLSELGRKGVGVTTAGFHHLIRWPTGKRLKKVAGAFDPDIIQYWMGRAGSYAILSDAVNVGWYGGYYKLRRFQNCDYHIGITPDIVRHIVAQGVSPEQTQLIHTYAEFPKVQAARRAEFHTPENAPLLLALARLHQKKGLDVLLKALADIPAAYLWIAGEGPLRDELEKLAQATGVAGRTRFLGWRNDRAALLAASDICVFPSRYEPFGTVTVDAWASATPLVAAASAGPKAYVVNGENGMLVAIDDTAGLARAINTVLKDDALRGRIVAGGMKTYTEKFSKDIFIRDSLAFYERVINGNKRRRGNTGS